MKNTDNLRKLRNTTTSALMILFRVAINTAQVVSRQVFKDFDVTINCIELFLMKIVALGKNRLK